MLTVFHWGEKIQLSYSQGRNQCRNEYSGLSPAKLKGKETETEKKTEKETERKAEAQQEDH